MTEMRIAESGYDYVITKEGLTYKAYRANRTLAYSNTSAYTVIQNAINDTTKNSFGNVVYCWSRGVQTTVKYGGSVKLGPYQFNLGLNTLLLPNHFTLFGSGSSTILIGNSSAAVVQNMWSNYTYDVQIRDMQIRNNAKSGDYGIRYEMSSATIPLGDTYQWWILLENVHVCSCAYPLSLSTTSRGAHTISQVSNFRSTGKILLNRVFDSIFSNIFCESAEFNKISTNHFSNWYIGGAANPNLVIKGGTENYPSNGNEFINVRIDNPSGSSLRLEDFTMYTLFSNSELTNKVEGSGDGSHPAIYLGPNTHHTTFTGCGIGNYPSREADTGVDLFSYLIYEDIGTHSNTFIGNLYYQNSTQKGLWWGDPTVSNVENRKISYYGASATNPSNEEIQYFPMTGIFEPGYSENGTIESTSSIIDAPGHWGHFTVLLTAAPGAGNGRANYLRLGGIDHLLVNITGTQTIGYNTSYIYHDPGTTPDIASIKTIPYHMPSEGVPKSIVHFWPDLEYLLGYLPSEKNKEG